MSLSSGIRDMTEIVNCGGFCGDHGLFLHGVFFTICLLLRLLYFGVERFAEGEGVLLGDAVRVERIFPVGF